MAIQFNADFNRFVDFAVSQNGSGKAIADAANGKFDVGGLARQVTVASGDRVGALFRSQGAKDVNNVTRDIFRNAIADMFGGESKIPDSIKEAMNMKKFDGSGRPLTAKRIMNVKIAIDQYNAKNPGAGIKVDGPGADIIAQGLNGSAAKMGGVKVMSAASAAKDMRPVTLTQKTAEKMIGKSLDLFGYTFPKDQKAEFAALLVKHGNGMPAKNLRMLSNYIANKAIVESNVDDEDVANIARDMKTWAEFKFGDARLNQLSAKFVERQNNYVKLMINDPKKFCADHTDVFQQVAGDAHRGDWNINGKIFKKPSPEQAAQRPKEVVDEFLKTVTNPNARKVISILMNQGNLADLECLFHKFSAAIGDPNDRDPQYEDIHTIPGGEMFVSRSAANFLVDNALSFGMEISKDGTTATVTVSIDKDISSMGAKYNETKIGTAKITQRTKIDLTKPMPEVVDVTFEQTYTPGKIRYNPNIEKLNI